MLCPALVAVLAFPFFMGCTGLGRAPSASDTGPSQGDGERTQEQGALSINPAAAIKTDRNSYTLRRIYRAGGRPPLSAGGRRIEDTTRVLERMELDIVATYRNRTGGSVQVRECTHLPGRPPIYRLEKNEGGRWIRGYDPICVGSGPVEPQLLPPGGIRVDTIRIVHNVAANVSPRFSVPDPTGTYRLVYDVVQAASATRPDTPQGRGDAVAEDQRTSNAFLIRE